MRVWLLIVIVGAMTGCAGQEAATNTPAPPAQENATLVPTEGAATDAPTLVRPTLPPTWTPGIQPTPTLAPFVTLTPDGTLDALRALPTFPACGSFVVDLSRTPQVFAHQQPLTVVWGAAAGADVYRVSLFDVSGQTVFVDTTRDTSYTFPGSLFFFGGYYGWEVRPFDSVGIQFCMPIGDDVTGQ